MNGKCAYKRDDVDLLVYFLFVVVGTDDCRPNDAAKFAVPTTPKTPNAPIATRAPSSYDVGDYSAFPIDVGCS